MSCLRDVRLLIAKNLDAPKNVRFGVLDVLNLLDTSLDEQGYQEPEEITAALRRLDRVVVEGGEEITDDEDDFPLPPGTVSLEELDEDIEDLLLDNNDDEDDGN